MSNLKNEIKNVLFYRRLEDRLSEVFNYLESNLLVDDRGDIDYELLLVDAIEYIAEVTNSMECYRKDIKTYHDER